MDGMDAALSGLMRPLHSTTSNIPEIGACLRPVLDGGGVELVVCSFILIAGAACLTMEFPVIAR